VFDVRPDAWLRGSAKSAARRDPRPRLAAGVSLLAPAVGLALTLAACAAAAPGGTPPITPGTSAAPRAVNIVMREYTYSPQVVDLVPGETVLLHVVNAGQETHEAVLGDLPAQLAWEAAEEAVVGAPPGPTPFVAPPAGFDGVRVVVEAGQRVDVTWTVPLDAASSPSGWFVGCHMPGHWAKGMVVPIRLVDAAGQPLAPAPTVPAGQPSAQGA
jgi:uncharacterized cupredoxin-like copper-binding protein